MIFHQGDSAGEGNGPPGPLASNPVCVLGMCAPGEEEIVPTGKRSTTEAHRRPQKGKRFFLWVGLVTASVLVSLPFWVHFAFSLPPERACVSCHEMRASVTRWQESGSAAQHSRCADCHFDPGLAGLWQRNRIALAGLKAHWDRRNGAPLKARPEPLFFEPGTEPGFYSSVPNHRCFQCKQIPGHSPLEQQMSHRVLIDFPADQPCKDCHNHDMRNGQRFYEKILSEEDTKAADILPVRDRAEAGDQPGEAAGG